MLYSVGKGTDSTTVGQAVSVTMPKKGDRGKCENYRTISLITQTSKILLNILLERLKAQMEAYISEEQAGFRQGRSTVQQIQIRCLRLLAEKYSEKDQKVFNCFVDFKKAFDSVWHEGLWAVLRSFGTGPKLEHLRANKRCSTGKWRINRLVQHDCGQQTRRPNIAECVYTLPRAPQENSEAGVIIISGSRINNLKFADDVDLIKMKEDTEDISTASRQFA